MIFKAPRIKEQESFTLIEVLVGIFLILIVFLGISGAYQLGLKVVGLSKNKIIATAIANGEIEKIRNLPYGSVGTIGASLPKAKGVLEETTATVRNNVEYTIETQVKYVLDNADGSLGSGDNCYLDYKRAEVKVSWSGRFSGEVKLVTDVAPKNKVEEINTCTAQPGGILSVQVSDPFGKWEEIRGAPLIEVFDSATGEKIDFYEPSDGKHDFPLVASTYKVVVSKNGYSSEQTYGSGDNYNGEIIATPEKPHPIILEGQVTEMSFSIDESSSFSVDTLSPWGEDYFSDSFSNENKISDSSNIAVSGGEVNLSKIDSEYQSPGFLISTRITPENFISWGEFTFSDSEPTETQILYQILYLDGESWSPVPNAGLPGNSSGFGVSPVDLSSLNPTTYSQLRLKGNLSTSDSNSSPTLYDWQVSWITSIPIPNAEFNLQGAKTIGTDADENPIYKYSTNPTSDSNGHISISDLEWDSYTFTIDPATGLDLVRADPEPQPIILPPDNTNLAVKLYLKAENSLLVTIQDMETLDPMPAASVRLFNTGLGYDTTQYTNAKGQTYFIPLTAANYNLEVQAPGYSTVSTVVSVLGDETEVIEIEEIE